jgi:hypothetical protein
MTVDRLDAFGALPPNLGAPQLPLQAEPKPPTAIAERKREREIASLAYRQFESFCENEGVTLDLLTRLDHGVVTDLAHNFATNWALMEPEDSDGKLLPAHTLRGQMTDYYRFYTERSPSNGARDSESQKRHEQLIEFRKERISLAISFQREYPQIEAAEQLLKGAFLKNNGVVFAGVGDLLTCYGMTLQKTGRRQIGAIALRMPEKEQKDN